MKKIISLLLSLIMVFLLVACSNSGTANKSSENVVKTNQAEQAPDASAENLVFKIGGIRPTTGGAPVYG